VGRPLGIDFDGAASLPSISLKRGRAAGMGRRIRAPVGFGCGYGVQKATWRPVSTRRGQIFEALRQLIAPPPSTKRPIGFRVREGDE